MTKLKMNITTKEDLKAENGRLKRELEVREKAINDLQIKLSHSVSEEKHLLVKKNLESALDDLESAVGKYRYENEKLNERMSEEKSYKEYKDAYHKEHSLVIQLDCELENVREQLRQAREESVKYGKENEHLWGLLKIKMEG